MTSVENRACEAIRSTPILFRTFQRTSAGADAVVASLATFDAREEIGLSELLQIGRAKLFKVQDPERIERNLRGNTDSEVRLASRNAFRAPDDEAAVASLQSLKGVKIAVGSAILSWCFPDRWPVIDRHAWRALSEFGLVRPRPADLPFTVSDYGQYCVVVRLLAANLERRPQEIDAWLYSFGKCGLTSADI